MIPEIPFAPELLPQLLVGKVGHLKYLMHEEGEEVQEKEVEGEVFLPVAEVVLDVIALIL